MEKSKVIAVGHSASISLGVHLEHRFFAHLTPENKRDISREIMMGQSFIISFFKDETLKAAAIFTIYKDRVHIRESGGAYTWAVHHFRQYAEFQARHFKLPYVSFCAENETIQQRAMQKGFRPDPNPDHKHEYIKEVQ